MAVYYILFTLPSYLYTWQSIILFIYTPFLSLHLAEYYIIYLHPLLIFTLGRIFYYLIFTLGRVFYYLFTPPSYLYTWQSIILFIYTPFLSLHLAEYYLHPFLSLHLAEYYLHPLLIFTLGRVYTVQFELAVMEIYQIEKHNVRKHEN